MESVTKLSIIVSYMYDKELRTPPPQKKYLYFQFKKDINHDVTELKAERLFYFHL